MYSREATRTRRPSEGKWHAAFTQPTFHSEQWNTRSGRNLPTLLFQVDGQSKLLNLKSDLFTIGKKLPHRHTLATTMLDAEYAHERRKLKNKFVGKWVTLSIDGWSSPQNAPWTGVAVDDYLYKLKDCTGSIKDAQFMAEITEESIRECEEELGCRVASVTGDNARNMVNSRTIIANRRAFKYGC